MKRKKWKKVYERKCEIWGGGGEGEGGKGEEGIVGKEGW